jgi:outer membrane protein TolC
MKDQKLHIVLFLVFCSFCEISIAQQLQAYIDEAHKNNPQIQAFELRYNIAEEKVNEADWLPNTELSAGYFVSETETRVGPQRARFSLKQMLPWFGTITARENYAASLADAEFTEITIAKRKLALSVATIYYQLDNIHKKLEILESNLQLLNTYEELALNAVTVDKATAVDVLKLQMRSNDIEQQIAILKEDLNSVQIAFNNQLNRNKNELILMPERLQMPEEDIMYGDDALTLNPELIKYDQLYESIAQSQLLNKREGLPMIGIGVDYLPVTERPEMNFNDNGKDILMPMVTVSIPVFNNRYKSISKQNELRQQEIESQKDQRFKVLSSAFAKAISQRNQARIKYLTQTKNIKQAEDATEILLKKYETTSIDFNELLDIQQLQLTFQLERAVATQEYFTQQSIINYLINK